MTGGDTARLYHRLTAYGPDPAWPPKPVDHPLVLQDFAGNDIATWPPQVKVYPPGLPVVALPREWPPVDRPATAVLAGAGGEPGRSTCPRSLVCCSSPRAALFRRGRPRPRPPGGGGAGGGRGGGGGGPPGP